MVGNQVGSSCRETCGQWQPKSKNGPEFSHGAANLLLGSKDPQYGKFSANPRPLLQNADVVVSLRLIRKSCENVCAKNEWLNQIIICSAIKSFYSIFERVTCRQQEDRRFRVLCAHSL